MNENTNEIQPRRRSSMDIDTTDRKILALLSEDASRSYAELSESVHLSAPAVHERVKKLKASGVIAGQTVRLDGSKIGRPFLSFVHVSLTGGGVRENYAALARYPEVEEVHSVAGDSCLLIKVRCENANGLETLLAKLRELGEITSTRSYVVLSSYVERGPQPLLD